MTATELQIDSLREIINIGIGKGAEVLNTMTSSHIKLVAPIIKLLSPKELLVELSGLGVGRLSSVNLGFRGPFSGVARIIFPTESAKKLVSIFAEEEINDSDDFDALKAGALSEIGNIVLNSIMGSIGNMLNINISYSVPTYIESDAKLLIHTTNEVDESSQVIVLAEARFSIEALAIIGNIVLYLELGSFEALMRNIDTFNETHSEI